MSDSYENAKNEYLLPDLQKHTSHKVETVKKRKGENLVQVREGIEEKLKVTGVFPDRQLVVGKL